MSDDYGQITARYYDAAYAQLRDSSGDAGWYRGLAREAKGPVCELGVGTGRVLLPIAAEGIACTGVDQSPAMLEALREKGPPGNLHLVEARMQDFEFSGDRFALIFAAFRAFQHLYSVDDQLACLAAVRRHLAPGGAFAFDVFVPRMSRMAIEEEPEAEDARFADGEDEIARYVSVRREIPAQLTHVRMRYERSRSGAIVSNEIVEFSMRHFFRFELEHLLARAGFGDVDWYGDFARTPFGPGATDFVIVARC
jgi:SAM-dependent methyltransferase